MNLTYQGYRVLLAFIAICAFILCTLIVLFFSHSASLRGLMGDFLIVILLYCAVGSIFAKQNRMILAFSILCFSFFVEGSQYLNLDQLLGVQGSTLAKLTIGATFDPMDLLAYFFGLCFICLIDLLILRPKGRTD